jgi:excinuclease ABC subunit B
MVNYGRMTPAQLAKQVGKLEEQMYEHARDLEFEEAARLRDRIRHIQLSNLGMAD